MRVSEFLAVIRGLFGVFQYACLGFEHNWNAIANRKSESITAAYELGVLSIQVQRALTEWADKEV
jgi:hypothetical protein